MKLDLESMAHAPGERWTHEFTLTLPPDAEIDVVGPVQGQITVINTGQLLLVQGEVKAQVRTECARCAEPGIVEITAPIEEEFSIRGPEGAPLEPVETIDVEEPAAAAFADNVLDLSELVRQQLLVSMPLRPLCTPDCKGLCPECGGNLNQGPCACPAASEESPFSVLKSMLDEAKDAPPSG
jgi:uncharacterized protein